MGLGRPAPPRSKDFHVAIEEYFTETFIFQGCPSSSMPASTIVQALPSRAKLVPGGGFAHANLEELS
jgi:hypothetical protein